MPRTTQRPARELNPGQANSASAPVQQEPSEEQKKEAKLKDTAIKVAKSSFGQAIEKRQRNQNDTGENASTGENLADKFLGSNAVEYVEDAVDTVADVSDMTTGTMEATEDIKNIDKTEEDEEDNKKSSLDKYNSVAGVIKYIRSIFGTVKTVYQHIRKYGFSFRLLELIPTILKFFTDGFDVVNNFLSKSTQRNIGKTADYISAASSTLDVISGTIDLFKKIRTKIMINQLSKENDAKTDILNAASDSNDDASTGNMVITIFNLSMDLGACISSWVAARKRKTKTGNIASVSAKIFGLAKTTGGLVERAVKYIKISSSSNNSGNSAAATPNPAIAALRALLDETTLNDNFISLTDDGALSASIAPTTLESRIKKYQNAEKYLSIVGITGVELKRCSGKNGQDNLIADRIG